MIILYLYVKKINSVEGFVPQHNLQNFIQFLEDLLFIFDRIVKYSEF